MHYSRLTDASRAFVGIIVLACAIIGYTLTGAAQPAGKSALENEASLREVLKLRLEFKSYVFAGEKFPAVDFDQLDKAKSLLGPYAIKATCYNRAFQKVDAATKPGAYGAVVAVVPDGGKPLQRYFTLYRLAKQPEADWRFSWTWRSSARCCSIAAVTASGGSSAPRHLNRCCRRN